MNFEAAISILKYYNFQLFFIFHFRVDTGSVTFFYNREYYDNMEVLGLERSYEKMSDEEDQYDRSLSKEAEKAIEQIEYGVTRAEISDKLPKSDSIAYINIHTLEDEKWCVELSITGYLVVSNRFDCIDDDVKNENTKNFFKFETIETLLHQISPLFVKTFNDSVIERLNKLN